jgi:hypothetical protein
MEKGFQSIICQYDICMPTISSVTEEHGALRHILCRGPFSASVPFWESKNFSGHTTIFPKDEKFFPETPTMFIATVDVYLL